MEPIVPGTRGVIRFKESPPQSADTEQVRARLSALEDPPAYDTKNYYPDEEVAGLAKTYCRYALVTGEKDFNLANTKGVFTNGFQAEGFQRVQLFEVPNQGHALPPAEWLGKALDFLDAGRR